MIFRGIKVRIIKRSGQFVNFLLISSNSRMRMRTKDFVKNVEEGVYEVANPEVLEEVG